LFFSFREAKLNKKIPKKIIPDKITKLPRAIAIIPPELKISYPHEEPET
jgi:lipid-binding SYLF domain-containing protein